MMSMKLVQLTSMFVIVCVCIMGSFSVGMAQSSLDIRGLMTVCCKMRIPKVAE